MFKNSNDINFFFKSCYIPRNERTLNNDLSDISTDDDIQSRLYTDRTDDDVQLHRGREILQNGIENPRFEPKEEEEVGRDNAKKEVCK